METTTLIICHDCVLHIANGEEPPAGYTLPGDVIDVTLGIDSSQHGEGCERWPLSKDDGNFYDSGEECQCELEEFSAATCETCSTRLAGERHYVTGWFE